MLIRIGDRVLTREEAGKPAADGDRPSLHGKMLGDALALMADLGRLAAPMPIPEPCLTCAFRKGTMPNQTAGTGIVALNCVLRIDTDRFACHHGMKDGEPQHLCVGYAAAMLAPFSQVREILQGFYDEMATMKDGAPDSVREAFDRWLAKADPERRMDVYEGDYLPVDKRGLSSYLRGAGSPANTEKCRGVLDAIPDLNASTLKLSGCRQRLTAMRRSYGHGHEQAATPADPRAPLVRLQHVGDDSAFHARGLGGFRRSSFARLRRYCFVPTITTITLGFGIFFGSCAGKADTSSALSMAASVLSADLAPAPGVNAGVSIETRMFTPVPVLTPTVKSQLTPVTMLPIGSSRVHPASCRSESSRHSSLAGSSPAPTESAYSCGAYGFSASTRARRCSSVSVRGDFNFVNSKSACSARVLSASVIASSPTRSIVYPATAKAANAKAKFLWAFDESGNNQTATSPIIANISVANPTQLSVSAAKWESSQGPIEANYLALREFLSGLMLITIGFFAGLIVGGRK